MAGCGPGCDTALLSSGAACENQGVRLKAVSIVAVVVAVLAIGGFVLFQLASTSSASSVSGAVDELRSENRTERPAEPGLPRQGVYEVTVVGSEALSRGPISVSRDLPTTAPMIVRHTDTGYEVETRYSSDHTEGVGYRLAGPGASAITGTTTVGAAGFKTTRDREWTPAPLRLPLESKVGDAWAGDYQSGDLDVRIESEVVREDTVDVGGRSVDVVVIESTQTIAGEYTGGRTEQFFYSPEHGLIVRYIIESDLEGPVNLRFDADQTVTSLEPAL
jgi:hypothetical protein